MEYLGTGHTQREARETFGISLGAINRWHQLYVETGEMEDKKPRRSFKKLDPEKLQAFISEHPDAYLREIGEVFGCSESAVRKAFGRLGITRKKRRRDTASKSLNKSRNI
jgi:transposase